MELKARDRWPDLVGNTYEATLRQAGESSVGADLKLPGLSAGSCCCQRTGLEDHTGASSAVDIASVRSASGALRLADDLPRRVFISYVHEDAERANQLQRTLERAGIEVWRDTERIWPGQDRKLETLAAISTGCRAFIACFSETSCNKASSYQNEELRLAVEQQRLRQPGALWLIPVRFNQCRLPQFDLGGGRMLDSLRCADLFGPQCEAETSRLVLAVEQSIKCPPIPPSAWSPPAQES